MSQKKILELLSKQSDPISLREISLLLQEDINKIVKQISQLIKYNEVQYKEIDRHKAMKLYRCKRKMKLYYIGKD